MNLVKFKTELSAQGLSGELVVKFSAATKIITDGKQKQYEIVSNRKAIVQNNLGVCNDLFEQLNEILIVGKILFKTTDSIKLQEYSFSTLKKRVHKTSETVSASDSKTKDTVLTTA